MQSQYLMIAENIVYKNNKLTCINIMDQFLVLKLPAESFFDLVAICGPGWESGEHNVTIKVQLDEEEIHELGTSKINVPNEDFVYNALAQGMKLVVKENTKYVHFYVYKDDELTIKRSYKVAAMFIPQEASNIQS